MTGSCFSRFPVLSLLLSRRGHKNNLPRGTRVVVNTHTRATIGCLKHSQTCDHVYMVQCRDSGCAVNHFGSCMGVRSTMLAPAPSVPDFFTHERAVAVGQEFQCREINCLEMALNKTRPPTHIRSLNSCALL